MLEPVQRTRTSRRPSMWLRAVCSEWVAIIPMMVKEITSAVTMSFVGGCIGVSPFDEHTISRINGLSYDQHQAVLWCCSHRQCVITNGLLSEAVCTVASRSSAGWSTSRCPGVWASFAAWRVSQCELTSGSSSPERTEHVAYMSETGKFDNCFSNNTYIE